jgi:hypothetical protein
MPSPQRRYLHTGEKNLLFASWPGDHLLDRAKRGDADLRRALVCVVKARTARVTVAVCEELADLDCAAFARKKFAPFVRGLFPVPLARLPQHKHDRELARPGVLDDPAFLSRYRRPLSTSHDLSLRHLAVPPADVQALTLHDRAAVLVASSPEKFRPHVGELESIYSTVERLQGLVPEAQPVDEPPDRQIKQ